MDVHFRIAFLVIMIGVHVNAEEDRRRYHECDGYWDVRYPYLVEVRYTGEPFVDDVPQRNYHKNRHGALITSKSVLTRGHDLDKFPDRANGEVLHTFLDKCIRGRSREPCLYVNTRRPMNNQKPQDRDTIYCGQNIIVNRVIFHPKFGRTAIQRIWDLNQTLTNTKFPFAILLLKDSVKTSSNMTVFPALVFPKTPLEMIYLYRRAFTTGFESHLCEYPHFEYLRHWGLYTPYATPKNVKIKLVDCNKDHRDDETDNRKKNRTLCWLSSLCPENSHIEGKWEGVKPDSPYYDSLYKRACYDRLANVRNYETSFIPFFGEEYTFISRASPDQRRQDTDDKLGSPIVCDGVALGLVSTWMDRGRSRRDAYVGTTFIRGWYWLLRQRSAYQEKGWHRATDDSSLLGEKYTFKMRNIRFRQIEYDKSIFELSLDDRLHFSCGPRAKRKFATLFISLAMSSLGTILRMNG